MTRNSITALAAVGVIAAAGATTAIVADNSTSSATSTSSALGAPPVGIVSIGSDAIQVDYGPSQPGPFTASNATARSVKISWPKSKDTLHPTGLKYQVRKNGKLINTTANPYITVGFTLAVRQFRICVTTVNSTGKLSPTGCTTFTGH